MSDAVFASSNTFNRPFTPSSLGRLAGGIASAAVSPLDVGLSLANDAGRLSLKVGATSLQIATPAISNVIGHVSGQVLHLIVGLLNPLRPIP